MERHTFRRRAKTSIPSSISCRRYDGQEEAPRAGGAPGHKGESMPTVANRRSSLNAAKGAKDGMTARSNSGSTSLTAPCDTQPCQRQQVTRQVSEQGDDRGQW
ncbi:hypothetical protein GCM10027572_11550 [Flexivirga lutea]